MNFVAIDFETANERRDSTCSVGLTTVSNGEITDSVQYLIRPPELRFEYINTKIHGIRESDVENSSTFGELWPSIRHLIENRLLVAHNASFDMSVLRHSINTASISVPRLSYLCTLNVARRAWPHFSSHGLSFLARALELELEHHDAKSDSRAAAMIVVLAAKVQGLQCPIKLANVLGVSIGEIYSHDEWIPSSAPRMSRGAERAEVSLPEKYDIHQHPFFKKQVEFTGTLSLFLRDEAQQMVTQFGGLSKDSISKSTDFLVTGSQDLRSLASGTSESNKLQKARTLKENGGKIQIISETDFTELIFHPVKQEK